MTGMAGLSRPAQLQPGGMWIDLTLQNAPTYQWIYKVWTGTTDIEVFRINVSSNFGGALTSEALFEVRQISADTVGAIKELVKQRIVDNGQVDSGDTVGEVRMVGRTNAGADVTVGYIKFVATDDMEDDQFGGTLSFFSTPDASSIITEHMRAINGLMESLVILKMPSLRLVAQEVPTASAIVQLSAAKTVVEFTGATATEVQGINSGHDSQMVTLHNLASENVTLKNQSGSAAAADRLKLPGDSDFILAPDNSVTVFYCTADSRWKLFSSVKSVISRVKTSFTGIINEWTAPEGITKIAVYGKKRGQSYSGASTSYLDRYGNAYAWGSNGTGTIGDSTFVDKSSPVAVTGNLTFRKLSIRSVADKVATQNFGIVEDSGAAYAWGQDSRGSLGIGVSAGNFSQPTAVLGGIKFAEIICSGGTTHRNYGISKDKVLYAWGEASSGGALGVGDRVSRSSPVAVLGGFKWEQLCVSGEEVMGLTEDGIAYIWGNHYSGGTGNLSDNYSSPVMVSGGLTFKKIGMRPAPNTSAYFGLTPEGLLYAWGTNEHGNLGVGDATDRSSPVPVLGGLTFKDFALLAAATFAWTDDGTVYAWGRNHFGQLGVGDVTPRSSPVPVMGGLKFKKVYPGGGTGNVYGLLEDGTLYAWGYNGTGELGLGDRTSRSSPVPVVGGLKFSDVYPGAGDYCHAMATNGILYAWGANEFVPNLGDGTLVSKSSPVLVVGAHGFDGMTNGDVYTLDVTPGETYTIRLSNVGHCTFGNKSIGRELNEAIIEYEKRGT